MSIRHFVSASIAIFVSLFTCASQAFADENDANAGATETAEADAAPVAFAEENAANAEITETAEADAAPVAFADDNAANAGTTETAEADAAPVAFADENAANAEITETAEAEAAAWHPTAENPVDEPAIPARIGTDIAFGVLYSGVITVGGVLMTLGLGGIGNDCDPESSSCGKKDPVEIGVFVTFALAATVAPSLAVHTSHAIWGGEGSLGWTYLGGLLGGAVGMGIGAAFWPVAYGYVMLPLGFVGGLVGAIVAYELTDSKNREAKYGTVSKIYPVIELGPERNILGVGMEF